MLKDCYSISQSGTFKGKEFKVEATLIIPDEIPELRNYNCFDIRVTSRSPFKQVNVNNFMFYLYFSGQLISSADLDKKKTIAAEYYRRTQIKSLFKGNVIAFEDCSQIHYTPTKMLILYKPDNKLYEFTLKY